MKTKIFLMMIAAVMLIAVITGCGHTKPVEYNSQTQTQKATETRQGGPIRTEPAQRPDWVDNTPVSSTKLSFIGTSGRYARATGLGGARYYAEELGRIQFAEYYGALMANQARTSVSINGITSDVFDPQIVGQQLVERLSQNVAQRMLPISYFTEIYLDNNSNRESYEVYVLLEVDKAVMTRAIDDYAQEQAAEYTRRAEAERDQVLRQQNEDAAEFFGGNISSLLGL